MWIASILIAARYIRRITHFYSRCTFLEAIQILAGRVISFRTTKSFLTLFSRESDELLTHCCCCWCHLLCPSQDASLSPLICNHFQNDSTSSSPQQIDAFYYDIFISPGLKWTNLNAVDLLIFRSIVHWDETTTQRIKGTNKKMTRREKLHRV